MASILLLAFCVVEPKPHFGIYKPYDYFGYHKPDFFEGGYPSKNFHGYHPHRFGGGFKYSHRRGHRQNIGGDLGGFGNGGGHNGISGGFGNGGGQSSSGNEVKPELTTRSNVVTSGGPIGISPRIGK